MKILIDENKYLTCFCIDSELENGIEINEPDDIESFIDTFRAYRYDNGLLVLDQNKLESINEGLVAEELRQKRNKICFPYINRGELWYSRLSVEQKEELRNWYQAWLDVTNTGIEPVAPEWLDVV